MISRTTLSLLILLEKGVSSLDEVGSSANFTYIDERALKDP